MKKTETKITRFKDKGYFIDIIDNGKTYEAWISKPDNGVSIFMFGCPIAQQSFEAFCEMAQSNRKFYTNMLKRIDETAWWEAPDNK